MNYASFSGIEYSQFLNTCVLASYAVACYPSTNIPILDYFTAYCRHFNKVESPSPNLDEAHPERSYERHFHQCVSKPGNSGYKILKSLHNNSVEPEFERARNAVTLDPVDCLNTNAPTVLQEIQKPNTLLLLFINSSPYQGLSMHSIVVGHDGRNLFYFDTNPGALLLYRHKIHQITDFGSPGDAFLVKAK
jgi:hypothetical protein